MTVEQFGGQKAANTKHQPMDLPEAARIVNAVIDDRRRQLQEIADGKNHQPIEMTGETETECPAVVEVDPARVCQLLLDFDEPVYWALDIEYPLELWAALAQLAGLSNISSFDTNLIQLGL